jgi:hypothetical protein
MVASSIISLKLGDIKYFEDLINRNVPFAFPRFGDGEWSSILGYTGQNCDGVKYTSELQNALIETLTYPHLQDNYYYGLLAVAIRFFRPHIEKFIAKNNLDITWTEATFLVAANRQGKLRSFLEVLQQRSLLYVGPKYLQGVINVLGLQIEHFIEIPERNAFEVRKDIVN